MEYPVYQALQVPLVPQVHQDQEQIRVMVVSSVSLDQLERRVLRVTQEGQERQDRPDLQGFQVPWDQLDHLGLLGHQDPRIALDLGTRLGLKGLEVAHLAHLDPRAPLVLLDFLVSQVYQAAMGTKELRDLEVLLGCRDSMGFLDSRVKKETEEREETPVFQGVMGDLRGLQGLQDHQDLSPTRHQTIMTYIGTKGHRESVFQVEQDFQGLQDQKETKEMLVLRDLLLKDRKENLVSSSGLMGGLSTSVVLQDCQVKVDLQAQQDLQVHMVLQARRVRSGSQVDRVDRV